MSDHRQSNWRYFDVAYWTKNSNLPFNRWNPTVQKAYVALCCIMTSFFILLLPIFLNFEIDTSDTSLWHLAVFTFIIIFCGQMSLFFLDSQKVRVIAPLFFSLIFLAFMTWYTPEWKAQGFDNKKTYQLFTASGFDDLGEFYSALSKGYVNQSDWSAHLAEAEMERQREKNRQERLEAEREAERIREAEENKKKQLEEIATLKKKFGGIPTRVVTYICDFDPKQKEMEQPFLFPISSLDAQARVIETCEHSWFFRQGGGAKIISNIAYR